MGEAAGVAVDSKDHVYVFNRGEHPVIVFDREGNFLRSWGEGLVRRAHGITIGPDDEVWLTDDGNHTIRKFTPEGKLLLTIGDPDKPATLKGGKPFNRPTHVALSPVTGDLFISDGAAPFLVGPAWDGSRMLQPPAQYRHRRRRARVRGGSRESPRPGLRRTWRVSILSLKGDLLGRVGGRFRGEKPGQFVAPHGVGTDSRGDLYVAEVSYTTKGRHEHPPREIRCLQKFARIA